MKNNERHFMLLQLASELLNSLYPNLSTEFSLGWLWRGAKSQRSATQRMRQAEYCFCSSRERGKPRFWVPPSAGMGEEWHKVGLANQSHHIDS